MVRVVKGFLDSWVPRIFEQRPDWLVPWFYDYFSELPEQAGRKRYARAIVQDLRLAKFDPKGKVVLDAGSGFGVTLMCFATLGASKAIGLEAFTPMAESSIRLARHVAPNLPLDIRQGSVHDMPLDTASVDFIYCYEAISHFLEPSSFLKEASRVLKPGGILFISDANNGANPSTVAEAREVWKRFEFGPSAEDFHGHRIETPYHDMRVNILRDAGVSTHELDLKRLAWGTFGMHGEQVVSHGKELLAGGTLPDKPPGVTTCPVDPKKGDHIENLMYPDRLAQDLSGLGFGVKTYAHFGGAKGPLIASANAVLQAFSPITLRFARALKLVATKK